MIYQPETCLVEMKRITKKFAGFHANDQIDFDVRPGEVHALLGENGAGKTTLMNILSGLYVQEEGIIKVDNRKLVLKSPGDAIKAGIGMVHQHFMLVPSQTVWENMILGLEEIPWFLPKQKVIAKITEISRQYGLHVDPEAKVWQLSIGEQQRVAILKVLFRQANILILDEPTAVLTPQESQKLFQTVMQMRKEGHGIVFISHKLDEVMEFSDRVTVLRKGRKIDTVDTATITKHQLAEMMVGEKVAFTVDKPEIERGETVMKIDEISVLSDRGLSAVNNISLELHENEIVGIAGIAGNGQNELCEAIVGLRRPSSGHIFMSGHDLTSSRPKAFISAGVRYIPADRKGTGLIPNMNINENSILKKYWQKPVSKGFTIDWKAVLSFAKAIVDKFHVDTPSLETPVRNLSGGNLQKLMLGRELKDEPKLLVAVHPTWGLDVAATSFVRETILLERTRGASILFISEDLSELVSLSDRLAVIHKGEFMGILDDPASVDLDTIGLMMAGVSYSEVLAGGRS